MEGVPSYGENQVFLVIDDNYAYSRWVPVILGTPTINHVVMVMRESEMLTAPPEWQYSCCSYEFANSFFMGMVGAESEEGDMEFATNTAVSPANLDEKIKLKDKFAVPAFGMLVLHGRTEQMMMLDCTLRVITQAPYPEDQAKLPNGFYVLSTYTQLILGSCNIAVVIQNGTSCAICMPGGCQIGRVITANTIPDPQASLELMRKLDEDESTPMPGLTTAEWQEKLIETLERRTWCSEWLAARTSHKGLSIVDGIPLSFLFRTKWIGLHRHDRTHDLESPIVSHFRRDFVNCTTNGGRGMTTH